MRRQRCSVGPRSCALRVAGTSAARPSSVSFFLFAAQQPGAFTGTGTAAHGQFRTPICRQPMMKGSTRCPLRSRKNIAFFRGHFFGLPEGPPDFSWPWFGSLTPESARADLHRRVTQQTQTTPTLHRCIATAIARQMIDVMTLLRRPGEYDALLTRPVREMCMVFWEGDQREPNQDQARDAGPMRFVDCREWDRAPKKAL